MPKPIYEVPLADHERRITTLEKRKVVHDTTIAGDGTTASPLRTVSTGSGISTVYHDSTLTGSGTPANLLGINPNLTASLQAFSYVANGTEGTEFTVPLPMAMPSNSYLVLMSNASSGSLIYHQPSTTRTTSNFTVSLSVPPSVGEEFDFFVANTGNGGTAFVVSGSGGSGLTFVTHDSTLTGSGTPSSPLSVVTGTAVQTFQTVNGWFGVGGDGPVVYDGTGSVLGVAPSAGVYTLASDVEATDITVLNGVTILTNGYRMMATGTFNLATGSFLKDNGAAGANATTTTPGVGGSARSSGFYTANSPGVTGGLNTSPDVISIPRGIGISALAATAGGTGGAAFIAGAGGNGANGGVCQGGGGGGGGGAGIAAAGGNAAGGGAITLTIPSVGSADLFTLIRGVIFQGNTIIGLGVHGSSGGSGGQGGAATSLGGGGSGASGGIVPVFARFLSGSGVVQAYGGAGGNGSTDAGAGGSNHSGASGGGGGGGGGITLTVYGTDKGSWTYVLAGGLGGSGGAGGGGGNGGNGGNGGPGVNLRINVSGDGT